MEAPLKLVRCTILALAGCETPAGGDGFDSGDSGFLPPVQSLASATQVGSEGFWGCIVEDARSVDRPAREFSSDGEWSVAITPAGTASPTTGTLTLTETGVYTEVDVVEASGCEDYTVAAFTGALTRDGATHSLVGSVATRPGAGRLLLTDGDLAAAGAVWGAPTLPGAVAFRLDGDAENAELDLSAAWIDCADPMGACPGVEPLAELRATR